MRAPRKWGFLWQVKHSVGEYEDRERAYEDAVASRYNRDYHDPRIFQAHDEDFAQFATEFFRPGDRLLDLGCGPASLWPLWERYFKDYSSLVGVDLSEQMITECKRNFPGGDFRQGSAFAIPVEAGTVDLLIASSVLHHIPDEYLTEVFKEMLRVLDTHGTIVGREPVSTGRLGDSPGWLSGALMSFRHMVYRLTGTREYPEPEIGEHHHAYQPKEFLQILQEHFSPKGVVLRHPVSSYVAGCDNALVAKIALLLDKEINHHGGHTFYYAATRNFCDARDVASCIENELKEDGTIDKHQFLALLQKASEILERELGKP